jgi:hypothetical protein
MNHYWTSDDHPAIRQAQIEDWIEDLIEFPIDIVEEACREWRQTQDRRPTPSAIRTLAIVAQRSRRELLAITDRGQDADILARCRELYGTCTERWRQMDCVCFEECKDMLKSAEEALEA